MRKRDRERNRDMIRVLGERKTDGDTENPPLPLGQTERHRWTCVHRVIHPDKGVQGHNYTLLSDQVDRFLSCKYSLTYTHTGPTNTHSNTQTTGP